MVNPVKLSPEALARTFVKGAKGLAAYAGAIDNVFAKAGTERVAQFIKSGNSEAFLTDLKALDGLDSSTKALLDNGDFAKILNHMGEYHGFFDDVMTSINTNTRIDLDALLTKHNMPNDSPFAHYAEAVQKYNESAANSLTGKANRAAGATSSINRDAAYTRNMLIGSSNPLARLRGRINARLIDIAENSDNAAVTISAHSGAFASRWLLNGYGVLGLMGVIAITGTGGAIGAAMAYTGEKGAEVVELIAPDVYEHFKEHGAHYLASALSIAALPAEGLRDMFAGGGMTEEQANLSADIVFRNPAIILVEAVSGQDLSGEALAKRLEDAQNHEGGINGYIAAELKMSEQQVKQLNTEFKRLREEGVELTPEQQTQLVQKYNTQLDQDIDTAITATTAAATPTPTPEPESEYGAIAQIIHDIIEMVPMIGPHAASFVADIVQQIIDSFTGITSTVFNGVAGVATSMVPGLGGLFEQARDTTAQAAEVPDSIVNAIREQMEQTPSTAPAVLGLD